MARILPRIGSRLQSVDGSHVREKARAVRVEVRADCGVELRRHFVAFAKVARQRTSRCSIDLAVDAQHPAHRRTGAEFELRAREQRARRSADAAFLRHGLSEPECAQLPRRQQQRRVRQPAQPCCVRPQRLVRHRAVDRDRTEPEQRQRRAGAAFRDLVGVDEVAEARLQRTFDARWHDAEQSVEHADGQRLVAVVVQLRRAHEAEARAAAPRPTHRRAKLLVTFLEHDLVAERALPQPTVHALQSVCGAQERLPARAHTVATRPDHRARADSPVRCAKAIVGLIREQRPIGIAPPRSEPACAREVHPAVAAADQSHEERRHLGDVFDPASVAFVECAHWRP